MNKQRFFFFYYLSVFAVLITVMLFGLNLAAFASGGAQRSLTEPDKLIYQPLRFQPPQAERIVLGNGMILYLLEGP